MRKVFSVLIALLFVSAGPAMAYEGQSSLPKELTDLGITADDLNDIGHVVIDEPTELEADIMQRRWRDRRCPRGYRLVVERIRIGRHIITRYRCVRDRWERERDRDRRRDDRRGRDGRRGRDRRDGRWDFQPTTQLSQPMNSTLVH